MLYDKEMPKHSRKEEVLQVLKAACKLTRLRKTMKQVSELKYSTHKQMGKRFKTQANGKTNKQTKQKDDHVIPLSLNETCSYPGRHVYLL